MNLAPNSNTNQDGSTVVHCKVSDNSSFLLLLEATRCNFLYFVPGSAAHHLDGAEYLLKRASKCCFVCVCKYMFGSRPAKKLGSWL